MPLEGLCKLQWTKSLVFYFLSTKKPFRRAAGFLLGLCTLKRTGSWKMWTFFLLPNGI